jgi:hypothetical protein
LSDGRACLPQDKIIQPVAMKSHPPSAQADGSGRHEYDLAAIFLQRGDGSCHRGKMLDVELTVAARYNAGAELDHRAPRRAQPPPLPTLWMLIFHGFLLYH